MWNRRNNRLLLVRVRVDGKFPIIAPISLAVLHETIKEAEDWLELWKPAAAKLNGYQVAFATAQWLLEFIDSIRSLGRLRLVEVERPEASVFIDLW